MGRSVVKMKIVVIGAVAMSITLAGCERETEEAAKITPPEATVGEVSFPVSCDPSVQPAFDFAVAMLHSFEFVEARGRFEAVAADDPACAMAQWGVAMTHYHPLWAPPTAQAIEAGSAAVTAARGLPSSDREALYIDAIGAFYADADTLDHLTRAVRYENAMGVLHETFPDDVEAEIFHALAMLSTADPLDMTYAKRHITGAVFESLVADMPNHPGLVHYIIHSYDVPSLAAKAEDAAHRYLEIASSMPHALHMSGHIFTQLAMWDDSIVANTLAVEAARDRASKGAGPQAIMNEIHALDYLVYAYIQTGNLTAAGDLVEYVTSHRELNWANGVVSFNAGAVPVRWAMERKAWDEAAELGTLRAEASAGSGYENRNAVALRHWARAIGAAHLGDIEAAEADLAALTEIAAELASSPNVWARNTSETFRLQAEAWIEHAKGNHEAAERLLWDAALIEDETDKSGLSPGRVLPAREQLGDLLMALGQSTDAYMEYKKSLRQAAGRLNSIEGAARAEALMDRS